MNILQALLSLTNKTTLVDNLKVTVGPGIPCTFYPGCMQPNQTTIIDYNAKYAGFLLITTVVNIPCCALNIQVQYLYSSVANNLACNVSVFCSSGYGGPAYGTNTKPYVVPVLPGEFKVQLFNNSNKTQSATVSIVYYG